MQLDMGLLRRNGDEEPQFSQRYEMKEKLISIGDDYWIEDDNGQRVFKVNGKAMRLRDTFVLENRYGQEVAKIKERALSVRDKMTIDLGNTHATVKKALIGFRERYHVEVDGGPDLKVHGNIVDHEYKIEIDDGPVIGEVSKKWFRVRDSYGIDVRDPQQTVLALSVAVAIDSMSHD